MNEKGRRGGLVNVIGAMLGTECGRILCEGCVPENLAKFKTSIIQD
jgi:hypothetical protein